MGTEPEEKVEGVGKRARTSEVGKLLTLGGTIVSSSSFSEAGTNRDLVLSLTLSALLRSV